MSLESGTKLGAYELVEKIGEGGMGQVYRARDSSLGRDVAVKVLPASMAEDAERIGRFRREAKLLAALTHQNVAAIHGFDEDAGRHYLVMELVEGEALDRRLKSGPLDVETALDVGRQVCEGLEAAHAKGIVHRDLKPGNVIARPDGQVKILDFGLAKALADEADSASALGQSPTLLTAETGQGVLLGTAAYMSPEQARGKTIDARSDNWAFGALLFEMLTGKRAFGGETVSDCLASVLQGEPDWTALPAETPPAIRLLLRRCLTKDARKRLHSIADARIELESVLADPTGSTAMLAAEAMQDATHRVEKGWGNSAVAALLLGALLLGATLAWVLRTPEPEERAVERYVLTLEDPELGYGQGPSVSPDGKSLAFLQERTDTLAVLSLETAELTVLPGGERGFNAKYSPDGGSLVFVDNRTDQIRRIPARGGPSTVLMESVDTFAGLAPAADGGLFLAMSEDKLPVELRYLAAGSKQAEVVAALADVEVFTPTLSPDGSVLLFATRPLGAGQAVPVPAACTIEALRLVDKRRVVVLQGAIRPAWSPSGHVVAVASEGALTAVPFDLEELRVTGDPTVVERPLRLVNGWKPTYSLARDGTLVYQTPADERQERPLTWLASAGGVAPLNVPRALRSVDDARISPDGGRLALIEDSVGEGELWVADVERGTAHRLGDRDVPWDHPVWSSDGKQVFATLEPSDRTQPMSMWRHAADFSVEPEKLLETTSHLTPLDATADGRFLLYGDVDETAREGRIMMMDLTTRETSVVVSALGRNIRGRLSPDGRWLAYSWWSGERALLAARPFPGPGAHVVLASAEQASVTAWSADSTKVLYWAGQLGTGRVLSATLRTKPRLELVDTVTVLEERANVWRVADYDAAGERLLWRGDGDTVQDLFILVRNFDEHLRRVAPPDR